MAAALYTAAALPDACCRQTRRQTARNGCASAAALRQIHAGPLKQLLPNSRVHLLPSTPPLVKARVSRGTGVTRRQAAGGLPARRSATSSLSWRRQEHLGFRRSLDAGLSSTRSPARSRVSAGEGLCVRVPESNLLPRWCCASLIPARTPSCCPSSSSSPSSCCSTLLSTSSRGSRLCSRQSGGNWEPRHTLRSRSVLRPVAAASSSNPNPNAPQSSSEPRAAPTAPPAPLHVPGGAEGEDEEARWQRLRLESEMMADPGRGLGEGQIEGESEEEEMMDPAKLAAFFDSKLPCHPGIYRGMLDNGLRYVILPNSVPPNRFEAHLQMHVGSVDELDDEQGLAHLIEHVTFLGSRKRERLLGTGARSNAYTDFHHTVFHVHSPLTMQGSEQPMLPLVLEALHEIAFEPRFLPSRIDKERRAVLSEAQMMNTIEYRVDCQLLHHLHSENLLGSRFPIGREEQVPTWSVDKVRSFHERWYFPANATLFVVGDVGSVTQTVRLIEKEFGPIPPGVVRPPSPAAVAAIMAIAAGGTPPNAAATAAAATAATAATAEAPAAAQQATPSPAAAAAESVPLIRKERHAVRPPVVHRWARQHLEEVERSVAAADNAALVPVTPAIFQHELLQNFALSLFCKNPVHQVTRYGDLRRALMSRIVLQTLQFRINKRYKSGDVPFLSIDLDHSDTSRENCRVSTLTVVSEAQDWEGATRLAVHEVRRLKEFGVTRGELTRYLTAMLKDSEHLAAMIGTIPSLDNLNFIMENDALGHTILDQEQAHECLTAVAPTITLEDVNIVAADMLEYIADYGKPDAPRPAAIVACVPTRMHRTVPSSDLEASPDDLLADAGRASSPSSAASMVEDVAFEITPEDIQRALLEGSLDEELLPEPEVEVPKAMVPDEELESLMERVQPHFVPVEPIREEVPPSQYTPTFPNAPPVAAAEPALVVVEEEMGIIQRQLSNGIRLNMKVTENEAKGGVLRIVAPGGRVEERSSLPAAVAIGVRALTESGRLGPFSREQVELFCLANQIDCSLEADEEFICMDFHFSTRHGGLKATFQLLHLVLQGSEWEEEALERAKQLYISHYRSLPKSLERITAHRMMRVMFNDDKRLLEPEPEDIARLTMDQVRNAVLDQLLCGHLELSVVGDISVEEVEQLALKYMGTVTALPRHQPIKPLSKHVIPMVDNCDPALRHQRVYLRDTDERARAYIAGAAPNRWGLTSDGRDVNTLLQPVPMGLPGLNGRQQTQQQQQQQQPWGRLLQGIFGKGENEAAPGTAPVDSQATPGNNSTLAAALAMTPPGVSVVEGENGQLFWRRRRHPLFAATCMLLLTEIMNARLFTTVRDTLGLTYDVSFEISAFERLPLGWFVVSVMSTAAKVEQAVDATINVLQGLRANRISQRELDRAKRTLLMRHESDLKDNAYWLGLLTHIQSPAVPRKDAGCVRDVPLLYEVTTVDDIYAVYDHLAVDSHQLFTCIGVAGPNAGEQSASQSEMEEEDVENMPTDVYAGGGGHGGRGTSMMTRRTE